MTINPSLAFITGCRNIPFQLLGGGRTSEQFVRLQTQHQYTPNFRLSCIVPDPCFALAPCAGSLLCKVNLCQHLHNAFEKLTCTSTCALPYSSARVRIDAQPLLSPPSADTMEALTTPLTTLIEWVWCAAQVGASNIEMFLFLLLLVTVMTISWHATRWQKKMLTTLHVIQTQLQSLEEAKVHQTEQMTEILKAVSQAETIKELLSIANEIGILKQQLIDAVNQLTSQTDTIKKIVMVTTEVEVLKKHLLEVLSQLSTMKSIAPEVAGLHKLVSTITSDCGKLGGMFNRLTETHGLVIHLPNAQKQESLMEKIQKNLEDYADKVQKNLDRKIEDLIEKTAVLRVVLDQKTEKQNTTYKEWHGHTNQQLGNAISLLRGLGPAIPEIKRVADMVTMGRDASSQAQHPATEHGDGSGSGGPVGPH